jgi:hypothetical protein
MTDEHAPNARTDHETGPGYETRDASVRGLLWFGAGLILACVVVELLMLGFYRLFISEARSERPKEVKLTSTENLYQQLRDLHRDEEKALESYGWVDRKSGVVRIPIERAMELVAAKGSRFGKAPKTELEMNSHGGTPVPIPAAEAGKVEAPDKSNAKNNAVKTQNPPDTTGSKP